MKAKGVGVTNDAQGGDQTDYGAIIRALVETAPSDAQIRTAFRHLYQNSAQEFDELRLATAQH